MSRPRRAFVVYLLVAAGVAVLDLAGKTLALDLPPEGMALLPWLDLSLGFNRGISFGLLHAAEGELVRLGLIVFPLGLAAAMIFFAPRLECTIERAAYALIAGGAIGNALDRIPDGAVTDFIDIHAGGWHFPTFNLADVAITIGAVFLLLSMWRARQRSDPLDVRLRARWRTD